MVCASDLLSFKFDPFNPKLLVTASDDAKIKGWIIPEGGLDKENDVSKPDWVLHSSTMDKISLIQFHPRARNVLLSASMDRNNPTLRLWDLKAQKEVSSMKGHKDMVRISTLLTQLVVSKRLLRKNHRSSSAYLL